MTPVAALAKLVDGTGVSAKITGPSTAALIDIEASGSSTTEVGATVLDTIVIQGNAETAVSPVDGYVATVSGTGTKTDAKLIETPQSISVIGRKQLTDQNAQSVRDALTYTPSFAANMSGQFSPGYDTYMLRGYSNTSAYLDGMLSNAWQEPYGLERIEVLRGPASVLYGQNNPGGLVNTVSKRPNAEPIHEVGLMTSSHGGIEGFFDFNGKLDKDGHLLYRLTGLGKNFGTQFDNGSRYQRAYIAPAVTWQPDADTSLTVLAKYQYDPRLLTASTVPYQGTITSRSDGHYFSNDWYASDPSYDKGSYRRTYQIGYDFDHRFNDVWSIHQALRYEETETDRKYLTASTSATSSQWNRTAQHIYEKINTFTVDTNAQAKFDTGPLQHTAIFGIDYRGMKDADKSGSTSSGVPSINIYDPAYDIYSGPAPSYTSGTEQNSWQTGLYAQDQIKWDRWTLLFGGRYDWYESKTYNSFNNNALTDEMDQHAFTKRIGLVYEFDNGIAPYISYSTSFQPQSGTSSPARGSEPFKPTTGESYEAGIKYQPSFMDAMFTVAVYDTTKQNVTTTDPDNTSYNVQTGEIRTRGFELSGTANITDNLRLTAAYSYIDAEVTKTNTATQLGKSPYAVPRNQASAWVDYTFDSGALDGLGLGGGMRYVGKSPGDGANTFWVPSATLFDAAIRYDFGKKFPDLKGLQLSVNATNLFDKEYVAACYATTFCYYGSGRTVYGTLSYKW
nr:TonB-dependent siderophore receptor [Agrobacterium tumefaciens]